MRRPALLSAAVLVLAAAFGALAQGQPGSDRRRTAPVAPQPIASGAHAVLMLDDALAFTEALEFVLAQVGYSYRFNDAERQELVHALAQNFPAADEADQVVLAHAREIWTRVQANWATADEADRREFALGVLILAFGEETVRAWAGPGALAEEGQALGGGGGGGGSGGGCADFDDCAGAFVDQQTWTNTFNAQGCWAAAGCSSYDSSSGSFNYDSGY